MNRYYLFGLVILSIIVIPSYAQRNANQQAFKKISSRNYERNVEQQIRDELDKDGSGMFNSVSGGNTRAYIKDNEIVFQVNALFNAKADHFLAVFNVTQVGESASGTDSLLNGRIEKFKKGLTKLGIDEKTIYVDMIYMIPTYEYEVNKKLFSKTYNEVPTGFEMQKNVHISFSDIDLIDNMVTLAAKSEIYDLVKLDFFVDDTEQIYDSLRSEAVKNMSHKIVDFKKLNSDLSETYHVIREGSRAIYPESQYSDYQAFVSQSLEAAKGKSEVTTLRKPKSVAYDQIPYGEFDIVIHPNILEPVVQYIYTLQVKYTLPVANKEDKKEYMLLTPNGDLKVIPVE